MHLKLSKHVYNMVEYVLYIHYVLNTLLKDGTFDLQGGIGLEMKTQSAIPINKRFCELLDFIAASPFRTDARSENELYQNPAE